MSYLHWHKVYTAKARTADLAQVTYALQDLKEVLQIHRDKDPEDPYLVEKLAEWDAYVERRQAL